VTTANCRVLAANFCPAAKANAMPSRPCAVSLVLVESCPPAASAPIATVGLPSTAEPKVSVKPSAFSSPYETISSGTAILPGALLAVTTRMTRGVATPACLTDEASCADSTSVVHDFR